MHLEDQCIVTDSPDAVEDFATMKTVLLQGCGAIV